MKPLQISDSFWKPLAQVYRKPVIRYGLFEEVLDILQKKQPAIKVIRLQWHLDTVAFNGAQHIQGARVFSRPFTLQVLLQRGNHSGLFRVDQRVEY